MKDFFMESLHPIIQKNGTVAIYYNGALEQLHTLKMLLSEKRINIKVFYFEPNTQNESKNNQLRAVYKHNQTLLEAFKAEHNISVIKLPVFEYLDINLDDSSEHHFVLEEIYSELGAFDAIIIHDETSLVHFCLLYTSDAADE